MNKKIAVIGAGLSGLTAAYRLKQLGIEVDVFEATNRVGGRVFTVFMENYLGKKTEIELGGQNITDGGEAANFFNIARELNLVIQEKKIHIKQLVYFENSKEYYSNLLASHHKDISAIEELSKEADNIGQLIESFCDDNRFLKNALLSRMMAYEGIDPYKQSIYHNIETLKCTLSGGVAQAHEIYEHQYDEVMTCFVKGGNALLAISLENHLEGRIHYNKALKKITLSNQGAMLRFEDESIYEYDHVILTIPAGAFNQVDFSESTVEKNRLQKMQSIGYGSNYKIALNVNLEHKNGISSVIKDNVMSFYNHDDTIQLLYVNDKEPKIELFSKILSDAYNHDIGECENFMTTPCDQNYKTYHQNIAYNWKNDKYFQGSYSGYSTSISKELDEIEYHDGTPYKSLFKPLNNILFFAGEHTTILDCIGTMEAAIESGERISKAIIQIVGRI